MLPEKSFHHRLKKALLLLTLIWTAAKSQAKINCRHLTDINSRYCGLSLANDDTLNLRSLHSPGACVMPWEFLEENKPLV